MKVTEHIKNRKETLLSFEILPPLKGENIHSIFNSMDPLMEFNPPFIDVTYHQEEVVYKKLPGGLLQEKRVRKRPGTVGICAAIMNRYSVDAVPHIICGGFSLEETEDALIDLDFLGIENVLLLRGDPGKHQQFFTPQEEGHKYAIDLIHQVKNLNNGIYLEKEMENSAKSNFCMGIAGYPEKHYEAPNMKSDIEYLKLKVEKGAEYIVTQMFFDNSKYFAFVDACRAAGITIPIIPGIKPMATARQLTVLPNLFHIDIPEELSTEVQKCKNNLDVKKVGTEWAINQCKELMERDAPCLHFYTMGKSNQIQEIIKGIK
ncbi:MAG: methylenetetrahydrofolate reductase (NADPH) [Luteibaculaceae bacterium]|jgi:methylenetetrahydrofolate reductase (NADPH)